MMTWNVTPQNPMDLRIVNLLVVELDELLLKTLRIIMQPKSTGMRNENDELEAVVLDRHEYSFLQQAKHKVPVFSKYYMFDVQLSSVGVESVDSTLVFLKNPATEFTVSVA